MDFLTIILVALGLSFDTFAVSLSFGVVQNKILFRQAVRVAVVLAIFQAGLLVIGYFLGSFVSDFIKAADHWVALGLLSFLGIRMMVEGIRRKENEEARDYTKPKELLTAAIGTSLDAFAVGISFALLDLKIWLSGVIIGAVTFLASMTAIRIGKSAGAKLGQRVEIVGGLILVAIGIKIFLEHILG
ncbi:MAG: manganese efflux pump MntP family protein [Bacteroidales bacterium]|jgi:putative Mn2+ efflux pump MntP|nr:manganese efflux pump MntP family protein [Bacteroidales bacterium]